MPWGRRGKEPTSCILTTLLKDNSAFYSDVKLGKFPCAEFTFVRQSSIKMKMQQYHNLKIMQSRLQKLKCIIAIEYKIIYTGANAAVVIMYIHVIWSFINLRIVVFGFFFLEKFITTFSNYVYVATLTTGWRQRVVPLITRAAYYLVILHSNQLFLNVPTGLLYLP